MSGFWVSKVSGSERCPDCSSTNRLPAVKQGDKDVAHEKRNLNVVLNIHMTHMTGSLNQLEIVFLSDGDPRATVV